MEGWQSVSDSQVYRFSPKFQWALKNNALSGITIPQWLSILHRHWRDIDWHIYWARVAFLSFMACFNSFWGFFDYVLFHRAIIRQQLNESPIFILGHPRTGTTLVHNTLAHDKNLAYCSTFQVGFPSNFISLSWAKDLLGNIIDKTRPMDNMPLHMDLPGEDEIATNCLTGGVSAYMPIFLMTKSEMYWDAITLEQCSEERLQLWTSNFLYFLKKVTYWYGNQRRLVIKSPVHTARIRTLLQLFPKAQFIFCHRDPYEVFQSSTHLADAYYWYTYLSHPSDQQITDFVVNQMDLIHRKYLETRALIPKGNLVEVSFRELDSDIVTAFKGIYMALQIPGWEEVQGGRSAMEYASGLAGFKKNDHVDLRQAHRALVQERLGFLFDTWHYKR